MYPAPARHPTAAVSIYNLKIVNAKPLIGIPKRRLVDNVMYVFGGCSQSQMRVNARACSRLGVYFLVF